MERIYSTREQRREDERKASIALLLVMVLALAGIFAVRNAQAEGLRFEFQTGHCSLHSGKHQGEWWPGPTFNVGSMAAACYQLGVSRLVLPRLGWRAALVDLGDMPLNEAAIGGPGPQPHWTATGEGNVSGATLGLYVERPMWGAMASLEGGAFVYRSQWRAVAYHASSNQSAFATPDAHTGLAPYLGVGMSYVTPHVTAIAAARVYAGLRANTLAANFDHIGPAVSHGVTVTIGLQRRF